MLQELLDTLMKYYKKWESKMAQDRFTVSTAKVHEGTYKVLKLKCLVKIFIRDF
jgi:hypothetical protein